MKTAVKEKHKIDINGESQILQLIPSSLKCSFQFVAERTILKLFGKGTQLNKLPIRVFFEAILDSQERDLFKKRIESDGEHLDLDIDCSSIVNGTLHLNFSLHTANHLMPSQVIADYEQRIQETKNEIALLKNRFYQQEAQNELMKQQINNSDISELKLQSQKLIENSIPKAFFKGTIIAVNSTVIDEYFDNNGKGSNLYEGWFLCDGQNDTPDLRGRVLVGLDKNDADYSSIGKIGGLRNVQLTENQMPSHTHIDQGHSHHVNLKTSTEGHHVHSHGRLFSSYVSGAIDKVYLYEGSGDRYKYHKLIDSGSEQTSPNGDHSHTASGNSNTSRVSLSHTGKNEDHENRQPFYVIAFIIYNG
jgi:microcystin-dependent protein